MFPYPIVLPKNPILASLRLLAWWLWHPSAWREYVARLDCQLTPDFALLHLQCSQWKKTEIVTLIILLFGVLPILVISFVTLITLPFTTIANLPSIIAYTSMLTLTFSWLGSTMISLVFGIVSGVVIGLLLGSCIGITKESQITPEILALVVTIGLFSLGLASTKLNQVATILMPFQLENDQDTNIKTLKGILLGGTLGVFLFFLVKEVTNLHQMLILKNFLLLVAGSIILWLRQKVHQAQITLFSLDVILVLILLILMSSFFSHENEIMNHAIYGTTDGVLYAVFFALPFLLVKEVAGTMAATIISMLIGWFVYVGKLPQYNYTGFPILLISLSSVLLGFLFDKWRAILFYPFVTAWHLILFYIEKKRIDQSTSLLPYHAALWDEEQWIPLYGLEQHLLLVKQKYPEEAERVLAYLNTTKQYRVVHAIDVTLDIRKMQNCHNIHEISRVHTICVSGEQFNDISSEILRTFKKISQEIEIILLQEEYVRKLNLTDIIKQLDELIRELHRTRGKHTKNYQAIAIQWRDSIDHYVRKLRKLSDVTHIPNLYVAGLPLKPNHQLFVGRKEIATEIERLLLNQDAPALLLFGQRRMGKTSLLYNLNRLLSNEIVPLLIDLQGVSSTVVHDEKDFFNSFARSLLASTKQYPQLTFPIIDFEALKQNPLLSLNSWLDEVEKTIGQRNILLVLDEIMSLEHLFEIGKLQASVILGWLRSQIQHRQHLKVLLSDSHHPTELKHWATYLINVQIIPINFLSPEETRQLVEQPVPEFPLYYMPDATERVLQLTFGHPTLVQLLCYNIVKLKNSQTKEQRFTATIDDVDKAADNTLTQGQFFFADIENQLTEIECCILCFIAQQGEGIHVSVAEIEQRYPHDYERCLQRLCELDLIRMIGHHACCFQVELIRRYFCSNASCCVKQR